MADNNKQNPIYCQEDNDFINRIDRLHELEKKYISELKGNAKFMEFVNHLRGDTQEGYIKDFANFKAQYTMYAKNRFKQKEEKDAYFMDIAKDVIWHIQQKKLFDMQCLWRAEKVEIPEITISKEFDYWSDDITNCKFIEPITEDEIELYIKFLEQKEPDDTVFNGDQWQNYEEFKEEHLGDPDGLNMPEWYQFYNMHRGTERLLLLPDYKAEIEDEYIMLGIREENRQYENSTKNEEEKTINIVEESIETKT